VTHGAVRSGDEGARAVLMIELEGAPNHAMGERVCDLRAQRFSLSLAKSNSVVRTPMATDTYGGLPVGTGGVIGG
jgi:hypothetical protein